MTPTKPTSEPSELAKRNPCRHGIYPRCSLCAALEYETRIADLQVQVDALKAAFNGKHPTCNDSSCVIPACREAQRLQAQVDELRGAIDASLSECNLSEADRILRTALAQLEIANTNRGEPT